MKKISIELTHASWRNFFDNSGIKKYIITSVELPGEDPNGHMYTFDLLTFERNEFFPKDGKLKIKRKFVDNLEIPLICSPFYIVETEEEPWAVLTDVYRNLKRLFVGHVNKGNEQVYFVFTKYSSVNIVKTEQDLYSYIEVIHNNKPIIILNLKKKYD